MCVEKEVLNGTINVNVTYGVVPSYNDKIGLCDKIKCPVRAGSGTLAIENPIREYFPPVSCVSVVNKSHI